MTVLEVARTPPQRWDKPFGDGMTDTVVDRLLRIDPFAGIDPASFPRATPLRELIRNDTRVVRYEAGQLVLREGDYGGSAFLVLDGELRVALDSLGPTAIGRPAPRAGTKVRRAIAQLFGRPDTPEVRRPLDAATRSQGETAGVFVQDIPTVLDEKRTARLGPGEVFGELGSLTRAPRSASVFAVGDTTLLEIRWQGLRDLMRYTPALADHIHRLYRENSLRVHLRETPLLARLDDAALGRVAEAVTFESFGSFDSHDPNEDPDSVDPLQRIQREPIVVEEGQPVESVLLIRNGFVRMTTGHGEGHRTIAYLGRGAAGAEEAAVGLARGEAPVWRRSLRAVGYVDVLRLPVEAFLAEVAPTLPAEQTARWAQRYKEADDGPSPLAASTRTLDFLVDNRMVNGAEAMVIDLERCTRCDDCVRACAATHEGNPRFVRQGPVLDSLQFAEACMHCVDPVCMIGCPTGAIHRDEATGVVRINDPTCVGCAVCSERCPYSNIKMVEVREPGGAIQFDEATGQPLLRATKCDLCVDQYTGPACQHACPHDALVRIDLSHASPLTEWADTNR